MVDEEVTYVWPSPWGLSKYIYIVNRYLPFVDIFVLVRVVVRHNTVDECRVYGNVVTWLTVIGILFSEFILMMRTYAIWDRRRSILITFWVLGIAVVGPALAVTFFEQRSIEYEETPPSVVACELKHAKSRIIAVAFILLVICETTIVVLTVIKAVEHLRHSRSTWVSELYRDGLMFYLYLLAVSLANVLTPVLGPATLWNFLAPPQRVLHSIFCNRLLVLILRQWAHANLRAPSSELSPDSLSTLRTSMRLSLSTPHAQQPPGEFSSFVEGGSTFNQEAGSLEMIPITNRDGRGVEEGIS